jgi:hypothetical protein
VIKKFTLIVATAIVVAAGSAVGAAERADFNTYGILRPLEYPRVDQNGTIQISAARAAALRECSAISRQYLQRSWGVREITMYRVCMAQHGQVE